MQVEKAKSKTILKSYLKKVVVKGKKSLLHTLSLQLHKKAKALEKSTGDKDLEGQPEKEKGDAEDLEGQPEKEKGEAEHLEGQPEKEKGEAEDLEGQTEKKKGRAEDPEGEQEKKKQESEEH